MSVLISALLMGGSVGLVAGLSPGPLMSMVISQTLRHNRREGVKIALAPLFSDLPIILLTLFAASILTPSLLGIVSLVGSGYLLYIAYGTYKTVPLEMTTEPQAPPSSLRAGVVVNILSPHPYLFWSTVGAPYLVNTHSQSALAAWGFVLTFYTLLIGAKVAVALVVGRYGANLNPTHYLRVMHLLALSLVLFALMLIMDAIPLLMPLQ
uniref:Putative lysine exporter protein (LYSE/YGGA) n=1 Tax=Magnetococcus massalia (strain MO-1) TaxID=451514 RepID=A0A1S7LKY0_MAGMO|nr:Putative lysine exporter protein (LYSE/YGGA) [Candidatus Magnetococcus massalia]